MARIRPWYGQWRINRRFARALAAPELARYRCVRCLNREVAEDMVQLVLAMQTTAGMPEHFSPGVWLCAACWEQHELAPLRAHWMPSGGKEFARAAGRRLRDERAAARRAG